MAIDILDKFYKTSAKAKVDLSLAQGPLDDAPDAGFDNGESDSSAPCSTALLADIHVFSVEYL